MVALSEAIRVAERERESTVISAGDCGDKWVFGFEDDCGKMDALLLFVYKVDGSVEYFLPAFFAEALLNGKMSYNKIEIKEEAK